MTKIELSSIFTILGSFIVYFLGGADTLLIVACSFIIMDYITGLLKGIITKSINSNKGFRGIIKKVLYIIAIILSVLLDKVTNLNESGLSFRAIMLLYIVGTEGISILENLSIMGIKMPKRIENILEKLKDEKPE